ncbi:hypothetical protein Ciccas_013518 [Cichlidogyrus casuarinus]|uniref:Peptidase A2 domain-containing protein n=1 Tax=Cichlidogyrus casuarinus TaxID=1844966 RepID=A0ABD2PM63_9PLAT
MDFVEGTNFAIWLEDYVKRSNYREETEKTRFSKLLKAMGNGKRSQYEGIWKAAEGERSPFTFAVQVLQLEADHEKERNRVRRMDFLHDNSISHAGRLQMLKLKAGREFDRSDLVCWFKEGLEEEKSRDLEQWIMRGKNLEEIAKKLDAKYGTKSQETETIRSISTRKRLCCVHDRLGSIALNCDDSQSCVFSKIPSLWKKIRDEKREALSIMQRERLRFSSTARHLQITGFEENKAHQRGRFVRQRAYNYDHKRTVRRMDDHRENEANMLMVESDKGLNFLVDTGSFYSLITAQSVRGTDIVERGEFPQLFDLNGNRINVSGTITLPVGLGGPRLNTSSS